MSAPISGDARIEATFATKAAEKAQAQAEAKESAAKATEAENEIGPMAAYKKLGKTDEEKRSDLVKHLQKKAGIEEGPKELKTRPITQIAKDFTKRYPRHSDTALTSMRRLVKGAKTTDQIRKLLKDVYKNPLMQFEVLTFIEESFEETTDMPDQIKELVRQAKTQIQDELVAEGGEAALPTEPEKGVVSESEFKNLYEEVSGKPEVDPHEIFNKLMTLAKGDLHNLQQIAGPLLRRLSDDCKTPGETDRALLQNRVQEMRAVVAISRVHLVFEGWKKLVDKQYGAIK